MSGPGKHATLNLAFFVWALLLVPTTAQTRDSSRRICTAASPRLPSAVHVPAELVPAVELMIRGSSTFRAQCRRLAAARDLYVRVTVVPFLPDPRYRGLSVIQRTRTGAVVAFVEILDGSDPTEWIAHELEHVIEQIEGVRVRQLCVHEFGTCRVSSGAFDTLRAVRAGRWVKEEVAHARRRPEMPRRAQSK